MRFVISVLLSFLLTASVVAAEAAAPPAAPDAEELTKIVRNFLAGVTKPEVHDAFWAEDLIYTGASGRRVGKADIMKDVRAGAASAPKPGDATSTYTAEDVKVQQYGTTAVVAFRLVSTVKADGHTYVSNYRNSGTFVKREGKWRVVNWQATKLPMPEEEAKSAVAAAEAAFERALLAGDTKRLSDVADESFVWISENSATSLTNLVAVLLPTGMLRYTKLEPNDVTITMYGSEAAVVRGTWRRQMGSEERTSDVPFVMTLANQGGGWRVIALAT